MKCIFNTTFLYKFPFFGQMSGKWCIVNSCKKQNFWRTEKLYLWWSVREGGPDRVIFHTFFSEIVFMTFLRSKLQRFIILLTLLHIAIRYILLHPLRVLTVNWRNHNINYINIFRGTKYFYKKWLNDEFRKESSLSQPE